MIAFALGFVVGVYVLQHQANLPSVTALASALVTVSMLAVLAWFKVWHRSQLPAVFHSRLVHRFVLFSLACIIGFSWAGLRANSRISDELPTVWESKSIRIVGVVTSLPKVNSRAERFHFDVEKVLTEGAKVPRHISLSFYPNRFNSQQRIAPDDLSFKVGQRWSLTVRLKRPHGSYNPHGFDYEAWMLSQGVRASGYVYYKAGLTLEDAFVWRPQTMIHYCRARVGDYINQVLTDKDYAGVIRALVIGDESQISQQQWQTYLNTGTNHLMSISGLHITMLSGLAYALMNWLWRRAPKMVYQLPAQKAATIAAVITATAYAALAGFSVPTQRTLYMLLTVSLMLLIGRRIAFPVILSVALLVVVAIDPWAVLGAGFWLSFGAVAAIVYASSGRLKQGHWLPVAVKTQWAVTLALIPALVMMFGMFSLISPIANAFAVPVISFTVVPPAIVGSLLNIDALVQFSHLMLDGCMQALTWLTESSIAVWEQQAPPTWTVLVALSGIIWHLLPKGLPFRYWALLFVLPMLLVKPEPLAQGQFKASVLDVGQGLSIVIQTNAHALLYDAGAKFSEERDAATNMIIPFLRGENINKIDVAVASHDDIDHVGGFPSLFKTLPIHTFISSLTQDADLLHNAAYQQHLPKQHEACVAGMHWTWDGVYFEVLSPDQASLKSGNLKDNNKSCVIRVSNTNGALLLTGDIEKRQEYWLLDNLAGQLQADVLVAPHHGSLTSSTNPFIRLNGAQHVVFTAGYRNRFKHPRPEVLNRYLLHRANLYRTDTDGAIVVNFKEKDKLEAIKWRHKEPRYWHH